MAWTAAIAAEPTGKGSFGSACTKARTERS